MNLYDLGKAVELEMRFAPTTTDWKKDLYGAIDRVHRRVLNARAWPFMVRRQPLIAIPDMPVIVGLISPPNSRTLSIIPAAGGYGLIAEMTLGSVEHSAVILYQGLLTQGCEVVPHPIQEAALLADSNGIWPLNPFRIEALASFNVIVLEPTAQFQSLPGPISAAPLDHGQAAVIIRQPRVQLPADAVEVLALYDDDGRPLSPMTRDQWMRSGLGQNVQPTGTPRWAVDDAGADVRLGGDFIGSKADRLAAGTEYIIRDPRFTATGGAGGTWPAGTWEVAICWGAGLSTFGPLTPPVTVTTAANDRINLAALPTFPVDQYGRELAVFVRDALRPNAPFYYIKSRPDQTVATLQVDDPPSGVPGSEIRYDEVAGPQRFIRLFPRSNRFRRMTVEYRRRAPHLRDPSDAPIIPEEHHELLVWLACYELASRDDQKFRDNCQAQAGAAFSALAARFPESRHVLRKGSITADDAASLPFIDRDNIRYTP